jgi:hypothetical protein
MQLRQARIDPYGSQRNSLDTGLENPDCSNVAAPSATADEEQSRTSDQDHETIGEKDVLTFPRLSNLAFQESSSQILLCGTVHYNDGGFLESDGPYSFFHV